jgi:hypothetical protein
VYSQYMTEWLEVFHHEQSKRWTDQESLVLGPPMLRVWELIEGFLKEGITAVKPDWLTNSVWGKWEISRLCRKKAVLSHPWLSCQEVWYMSHVLIISYRWTMYGPVGFGKEVWLLLALYPSMCSFGWCFLFSLLQIFKYTTCFIPAGLQVYYLD